MNYSHAASENDDVLEADVVEATRAGEVEKQVDLSCSSLNI